MKNKLHNYPHYVISAVREWYIHNANKYITLDEVRQMHPKNVLSTYLEWEGIYGYTETILAILKDELNDTSK